MSIAVMLLVFSLSSPRASAFVISSPFAYGCAPGFQGVGFQIVNYVTPTGTSAASNSGGTAAMSFSPGLEQMSIQASQAGPALFGTSANYTTLGSIFTGTAANTCYTPSAGGTHTVTFTFSLVQYSPILWANCSGLGSATSTYAANLTVDVFDVTTGSFVTTGGHPSSALGTHSISCTNSFVTHAPGVQKFTPTLSPSITFVASDTYLYWFGSYVHTDAVATSGIGGLPTAVAHVLTVTVQLQSINCQGC